MDDPTIDVHGCPTQETLDEIALWPKERGWGELMRFVRKAWKFRDYDSNDGGGLAAAMFVDGSELWLAAPLGWSGNEDLLAALRENRAFWSECLVALPAPTQGIVHYQFRLDRGSHDPIS